MNQLFTSILYFKMFRQINYYRSDIECPISWDEFVSSFEFCFQSICVYDENTLAVAVVSFPINIYSRYFYNILFAK